MKLDRDRIRNLMPDRAKPAGWYEITADASSAEVRIYDEISLWGVTAEDFVNDIEALNVDRITVRINSPGGSVFDGIAIYNALRGHRASITTQVDGIAASAASFIAQAGDRRYMRRASQMMVHNAQGLAMGDAATMREMADMLGQQNEVIAQIYADRSADPAQDQAYYLDLMAATTWLTADGAVEAGLADEAEPAPARAQSSASAEPTAVAEPAVAEPAVAESDGEASAPTSTHLGSTSNVDHQDVDWSDLFTMSPEELMSWQ